MQVDFTRFQGILPYASELYGVYQPLLGWKSQRISRRFEISIEQFRSIIASTVLGRFTPKFIVSGPAIPQEVQFRIDLGTPAIFDPSLLSGPLESILARKVRQAIIDSGRNNPEGWKEFTQAKIIDAFLQQSEEEIRQEYQSSLARSGNEKINLLSSARLQENSPYLPLESILARESAVAGLLAYFNSQTPLSTP